MLLRLTRIVAVQVSLTIIHPYERIVYHNNLKVANLGHINTKNAKYYLKLNPNEIDIHIHTPSFIIILNFPILMIYDYFLFKDEWGSHCI